MLESESAPESRCDGRQVINLASNNYLGLTTHPKLREAALDATRKYGVGSGAVRTISGTMSIHMQLEDTNLWGIDLPARGATSVGLVQAPAGQGPVQAAATAALDDDAHVEAQRAVYRRRLERFQQVLAGRPGCAEQGGDDAQVGEELFGVFGGMLRVEGCQ